MQPDYQKKTAYKININEKRNDAFRQLAQVIEVLEFHKMIYWIEYGTLLGAVREKTVIPWDSDFDLAIWHHEYEKNKNELITKLDILGFSLDFSDKDRIKIFKKSSSIGGFKIDLHLYKTNGNTAYISYNLLKKSFLNNIIYKIYRGLKLFDSRTKQMYRTGKIIKQIMKFQNEIPDEFILIPGRFNSEKSYKVIINKIEYDKDKEYLRNINLFHRLIIHSIELLPKKLIHMVIDILANLVENIEVTNHIQAIPVHFFHKFTTIQFGPLFVACPKDYIGFLRFVYGDDWHIPNHQWDRTAYKNIERN